MKKYSQYLIDSSYQIVNSQRKDGSFPPGSNGPHNQLETPVRVTCHWLISLIKSYNLTRDVAFEPVINHALTYLLSEEIRPFGLTVQCRDIEGLDKVNALIGQAWYIEALCYYYNNFSKLEEVRNRAFEIFDLHPFNEKYGLWEIFDIDGSRFRTIYDLVINHQIWFAACSSDLLKSDLSIHEHNLVLLRIEAFLKQLEKNLTIKSNGFFEHNNSPRLVYCLENPINFLKVIPSINKLKRTLKSKEDLGFGYHTFHLHGLSILKTHFPSHSFFANNKISKALNLLKDDLFSAKIVGSRYGLHYNPPGLEAAFSLRVLGENNHNFIEKWLETQFEITWSNELRLMNKVNFDQTTYASRIYELVRLLDYENQAI